jgi:hypothetical protein
MKINDNQLENIKNRFMFGCETTIGPNCCSAVYDLLDELQTLRAKEPNENNVNLSDQMDLISVKWKEVQEAYNDIINCEMGKYVTIDDSKERKEELTKTLIAKINDMKSECNTMINIILALYKPNADVSSLENALLVSFETIIIDQLLKQRMDSI